MSDFKAHSLANNYKHNFTLEQKKRRIGDKVYFSFYLTYRKSGEKRRRFYIRKSQVMEVVRKLIIARQYSGMNKLAENEFCQFAQHYKIKVNLGGNEFYLAYSYAITPLQSPLKPILAYLAQSLIRPIRY